MLELIDIRKDYPAGSGVVHALQGVDLQFRESEFVSILGPSGCGKSCRQGLSSIYVMDFMNYEQSIMATYIGCSSFLMKERL